MSSRPRIDRGTPGCQFERKAGWQGVGSQRGERSREGALLVRRGGDEARWLGMTRPKARRRCQNFTLVDDKRRQPLTSANGARFCRPSRDVFGSTPITVLDSAAMPTPGLRRGRGPGARVVKQKETFDSGRQRAPRRPYKHLGAGVPTSFVLFVLSTTPLALTNTPSGSPRHRASLEHPLTLCCLQTLKNSQKRERVRDVVRRARP